MLQTGLVSISFRHLSVPDIIQAVKEAGLDGIEWGGDVHVPAGDISVAEKTHRETTEAGLKVMAYGSYYRVGTYTDPEAEFAKVLDTAIALGAPLIRIWAGNKGSESFGEGDFNSLVSESRAIADMAHAKGMLLSFECHGGTYTDDYRAALRLIRHINRLNAVMYWQPNQFMSEEYNLESAKALSGITTNIHTFHWSGKNRYPLSEGIEIWKQYVSCFKGGFYPHNFLLEFMHDNSVDSLKETAEALRIILA